MIENAFWLLRSDNAGAIALSVMTGAVRLALLANLSQNEAVGAAFPRAVEPGHRESAPDGAAPQTVMAAQAIHLGFPVLEVEGRVPNLRLVEGAGARDALALTFVDADLQLELGVRIQVVGDLFRVRSRLLNRGASALRLMRMASFAAPLPGWARTVWLYDARWAGEFRLVAHPISVGEMTREARGGRAGFAGAGFTIVGEASAGAGHGRFLAAALEGPGAQSLTIERNAVGEGALHLGEPLGPAGRILAPGEVFEAAPVIFTLTDGGFNGVRRAFHSDVRGRVSHQGPRKVHFNTWEAAYFDLDMEKVIALAEDAAALGAERFVLDDGWFEGRTSDAAGLGDWRPDPSRFPNGLGPIIERVHALGMDFGLWVEPEMANPDSAILRAHPDWAVGGVGAPTQRNQLLLDLTKPEAADYIFAALDRLLTDYPVAYLKWDHNREFFHSRDGPSAYDLSRAARALLARVREAHPKVEIEACASGGARIDPSVFDLCARVWPSDQTDAVERLRMQTAASLFLPLSVLGAHVSAAKNPTTGRRIGIDFRARIAMFGHMGIEAAPAKLEAQERARLAEHIAAYKRWRALIHGGRFSAWDTDEPGGVTWLVVAEDGAEALALIARADYAAPALSAPVRIEGLDRRAEYRVRLEEPWPSPASRYLADPAFWRGEPILSGAILSETGLALPLIHPETAWLVSFMKVDG